MSIRKILVPLSGVNAEAPVVGTALVVARKFGAQVVGLFVRPDPTEALPYLGDGVSGQVIEQLMKAAKEASDVSSGKARESFTNAVQKAGVPLVRESAAGTLPSARFLDVTGHRDDVVAAHAQLSDIIVFGEATSGVAGGSTLEAAMMSAGRPVLIAPKTPVPAIGGTVAIGWDDSPVAAHAVTAAMPFLDGANRVIIFSIGKKELDPAPASMLADYLALHGVVAEIHLVEAQGQPIGSVLLANAEKADVDLLVVGGYGHSRLREFILGGATQHIRSHATIPVLMAH